jgi:biopolymer transport protein ExbB/TolQ
MPRQDKRVREQLKDYVTYRDKLTNVRMWLAVLIGLALTIVIYTVVGLYLEDFEYVPIYSYLFEQGWIPYVITFFFGVAIAILYLKIFRIKKEYEAFGDVEKFFDLPGARETAVEADVAERIYQRVKRLPKEKRKLMLVRRVEKAIVRLMNTRSTSEVDDIIVTLSEIDSRIVEASYMPVRFLAGVIPILGFLGTVYGIGIAITTFAGVLGVAQSFQEVKPALEVASAGLGTAFNTTLIALFFSGIILLVNAVIEKREENLLSAVDEYCIDRLVSRIRILSQDVNEVIQAMDRNTTQVIDGIEGGASTMDSSVKNLQKNYLAGIKKSTADAGEAIAKLREGLSGDALDDVKDSTTSIADFVEQIHAGLEDVRGALDRVAGAEAPGADFGELISRLAGVAEKLEPLGAMGDSFQKLENIDVVFNELRDNLAALIPAINGLSVETAKGVSGVLYKLLKVLVVAHRLNEVEPQKFRETVDERRLRAMFEDDAEQHTGVVG